MRKKGYSADSIKEFVRRVGISKRNTLNDLGLLNKIAKQNFKHLFVKKNNNHK